MTLYDLTVSQVVDRSRGIILIAGAKELILSELRRESMYSKAYVMDVQVIMCVSIGHGVLLYCLWPGIYVAFARYRWGTFQPWVWTKVKHIAGLYIRNAVDKRKSRAMT